MGASNLFKVRKDAFEIRTKDINTTYTVRVGGSADGHHVDRVITITNPAANFHLDVPAGSYFGQQLLISLLENDETSTVTVHKVVPDATVGLTDVGDYVSMEYVNDTAGWILLSYEVD